MDLDDVISDIITDVLENTEVRDGTINSFVEMSKEGFENAERKIKNLILNWYYDADNRREE